MSISSYCSLAYLAVFLPAVILLYSLAPRKARPFALLFASYGFFWMVSGKLLAYLLVSTFSIHHAGIWLALTQKERDLLLEQAARGEKKEIRGHFQKKQRRIVLGMVCLHVGILAALKYASFLGGNLNTLLAALKIPFTLPIPSWAVPIGISFYTLQAVSYILDVYHEKFPADRNLGRLALYMAFFPQVMEGPICRYRDTASQLWEGAPIRFRNLAFGLQRILFGLMKKVVIADRLNAFIQSVFGDYASQDGGILALSVVLYTCQLYMEFSGTMDVVLGSGEIFGIALPENFRQPFFSRSISEFWQRWHITLGTWFKDYIFYPLSMSGPLKKLTARARKRLGNHFGPLLAGAAALFCVWVCNGLWHGAGWHYLFFGMYHFVLILAGNLTEPLARRVTGALHIHRERAPWKVFQILRTGLLVCVGELFFRAESLRDGLAMFRRMVTGFSLASIQNGAVYQLGMDKWDFLIVLAAVLVVLGHSMARERGAHPRQWIAGRCLPVRWAIYYGLILFLILFGAYGTGYVPVDPIYANF